VLTRVLVTVVSVALVVTTSVAVPIVVASVVVMKSVVWTTSSITLVMVSGTIAELEYHSVTVSMTFEVSVTVISIVVSVIVATGSTLVVVGNTVTTLVTVCPMYALQNALACAWRGEPWN
jgi:hypothetical protein